MAYITKKQYDQLVSIHTDLYNQLSSLVTNLGTQSYDAAGWLLSRIKHADKFYHTEIANVTVPAGTSYTFIDYSGACMHKHIRKHRSQGTTPNTYVTIKNNWGNLPFLDLSIRNCNYFGWGAVGDYAGGRVVVTVWDTVNNIYECWNFFNYQQYEEGGIEAYFGNLTTADSVQSCIYVWGRIISSTTLEFIRNTTIDFRAVDVRQELIDLGFECSVGLELSYDEELAVNRPLLTIHTQKTLNENEVSDIVDYIINKKNYAIEITRIENVLASPRRLIYKVTPIEAIQEAIAKVVRVGREIPVLPLLRGGRIEITEALIPNWLNRLRPDIKGRVHSVSEINEILTTKPYEVIP